MRTTHLLYLHGFRSSPQSVKARAMADVVQQMHPQVHWWCPALPPSPAAAIAQLRAGVVGWAAGAEADQLAVMGSSLGGFYAAVLARELRCKAVLINPAPHPARDLRQHIGTQTHWHDPDDAFFFAPAFIDELEALGSSQMTAPANTLALIAKGDEVLDWREMAVFCAGGQIQLIDGGDHALSDFSAHLGGILAFLRLA